MGEIMSEIVSDYLFALPRPLFGIARFFDFGGTFDEYNISSTGEEADMKALLSDWAVIGQDLMKAAGKEMENNDPRRG